MSRDKPNSLQTSIKEQTNQQRATQCVFFCTGVITAIWAVIIPYLKLNTGVSDAALGGLIVCMGVGALIMMPIVGPLSTRFGCRKVIFTGYCLLVVSVITLPFLQSFWLLAFFVILLGAGMGSVDCAMNIQAILVEKESNKTLMSGFHGFYSLGGIAGAALITSMLFWLPITSSVMMAVCVLTAYFLFYQRYLLPYGNENSGPAFAAPKGSVLTIGLICFCFFLAEGTVLDWSSVFLTEYRAFPLHLGGIGFAAFSIAMTIGRLTGDKVVSRFGGLKVVVYGTLVAALGLVGVLALPHMITAIGGYFLIGLGAANVVPVMFSAIANQTVMSQSTAVPAVSTIAYSGVLLGPATIGMVAESYSLPLALGLVGCLFLLVLMICKSVPYQQINTQS